MIATSVATSGNPIPLELLSVDILATLEDSDSDDNSVHTESDHDKPIATKVIPGSKQEWDGGQNTNNELQLLSSNGQPELLFDSDTPYSTASPRNVFDNTPLFISAEVPLETVELGMPRIDKPHSSNKIQHTQLRCLFENAGDAVQDFGGVRSTWSPIPVADPVSFRKCLHSTNISPLQASNILQSSNKYEVEIKIVFFSLTYPVRLADALSDFSASSKLFKEEHLQSYIAKLKGGRNGEHARLCWP